MTDITTFFPLVSALFVLALGLIVFLHGGRVRTNFTFVLFTVAIVIWLLGTFMMFLDKDIIDRVIFWDKFIYMGVVFIPAIMYHFGLALVGDTSTRRKRILALGYVLSTLFLLLIPTGLFVDGAYLYSWGAHSKAQLFHSVFLVYFATYLLLWFFMVNQRYTESSDPSELSKLRFVFIGFAVLAVFGSLGFLPAYGISVYPFSYMSGVIFATMLAYTIFKFQLFEIKVIAAEFLIFMIWIFVLIQVMTANTLQGTMLSGAVLVFVVILGTFLVQSVDDEVEQREKIEKLAGELRETNKRQELLIHFIGHEVKGYLTKDASTLAALQDGDFGPLPPKLKGVVSRALAESRHGAASVASILKASNLKSGETVFNKAPFDLKKLVAEVVEKLRPMAAAKGLALSFTASEGDCTLNGDKVEIGDHVLRNLIDNAISYTPIGAVDVSLTREGGRLVVRVHDTGIGITDEDKKVLFTEGGHGKDSIRTNVHSTGYGLFIVKEIVEAHGGTARLESAGEGEGTTAVVEFPA